MASVAVLSILALLVVGLHSMIPGITPKEATEQVLARFLTLAQTYGFVVIVAGSTGLGGYYGALGLQARMKAREAGLQAEVRAMQRATDMAAKRQELDSRRLADELRAVELQQMTQEELSRFHEECSRREAARRATQAQMELLRRGAEQWSTEEQELLDRAIAATHFDAFDTGEEIWAHVATALPHRTGAECRARYNYMQQARQRFGLEETDRGGINDNDDVFGADAPIRDSHVHTAGTDKEEEDEQSDCEGYSGVADNYEDSDVDTEDADIGDDDRERLDVELDPAERGSRLVLKGMLRWNIGTLQPEKVQVQAACVKCSRKCDLQLGAVFADESSVARRCEGCSNIQRAQLRPCLVHEMSSVLWYCDLENLHIVDVLSSTVRASCIRCMDSYVMPLQRNIRAEQACHQCYEKLALAVKTFVIEVTDSGPKSFTSGLGERLSKARSTNKKVLTWRRSANFKLTVMLRANVSVLFVFCFVVIGFARSSPWTAVAGKWHLQSLQTFSSLVTLSLLRKSVPLPHLS